MDTVLVVGIVLLHENGVVLVHKRNPQMWALLGGKIDPNDSHPTVAAQRELIEECGLEVALYRFEPIQSWHTDTFRNKKLQKEQRFLIVYYYVEITDEELNLISNKETDKHLDVMLLPLFAMNHLRDHDREAVEKVVGSIPKSPFKYVEYRTLWKQGPDEYGRLVIPMDYQANQVEEYVKNIANEAAQNDFDSYLGYEWHFIEQKLVNIPPCPFCGLPILLEDLDDHDTIHSTMYGWIINANGDKELVSRRESKSEDPSYKSCVQMNCLEHRGGCGLTITADSKEEVIEKWCRRVKI